MLGESETTSEGDSQPRWVGVLSAAISGAVLIAVIYMISTLDFAKIWAIVPSSPLFWATFAIFYFSGPIAEWLIFNRLWNLPSSGFPALIRKQVSNDLLLGYLGEVYFYGWAKKQPKMVEAPFGAVKDVAILSALTGNLMTLLMLVLAWPLLHNSELGQETRTVVLSLSAVLGTSILAMFFRKRIFSLGRADLAFVATIHIARIIVLILLSAIMWNIVLPAVPIAWWFILATIRMLISRLPFIPNKDVVFAGLAVFLLGRNIAIAELMTMMAGIILVAHLAAGAIFGSTEFLKWRK